MEYQRAALAKTVEESLGRPDELAAEIRAHLRGIKSGSQQLKFMSDRNRAGDVRTAAAVLCSAVPVGAHRGEPRGTSGTRRRPPWRPRCTLSLRSSRR